MKLFVMVFALVLFCTGVAVACDDHNGPCKIEDWRSMYHPSLQIVVIEGTTTCDTGRVTLRVYDEARDESPFVGIAETFITGHTFQASIMSVGKKPASVSFKANIEGQ